MIHTAELYKMEPGTKVMAASRIKGVYAGYYDNYGLENEAWYKLGSNEVVEVDFTEYQLLCTFPNTVRLVTDTYISIDIDLFKHADAKFTVLDVIPDQAFDTDNLYGEKNA